MYGLMVAVERLCHVGISTHTAGKSNTKEDLPQKFLLPQKVQHNLTDLINLCCDTSGPEEQDQRSLPWPGDLDFKFVCLG